MDINNFLGTHNFQGAEYKGFDPDQPPKVKAVDVVLFKMDGMTYCTPDFIDNPVGYLEGITVAEGSLSNESAPIQVTVTLVHQEYEPEVVDEGHRLEVVQEEVIGRRSLRFQDEDGNTVLEIGSDWKRGIAAFPFAII